MQLVRPGEGTEDTRQVATRDQVGDDNWDLVAKLADRRLVVTGRDEETGLETVEIVHEVLIRHWQPLQDWIEQDRQFRVWQNQLRDKREDWEKKEYIKASRALRERAMVEMRYSSNKPCFS